jgi:hypothetical protein
LKASGGMPNIGFITIAECSKSFYILGEISFRFNHRSEDLSL